MDEDEDEEEDDIRRVSSSVTVPIIKTAAGKSFGLVNKIRSMAASKVFAVMKLKYYLPFVQSLIYVLSFNLGNLLIIFCLSFFKIQSESGSPFETIQLTEAQT